MDALIVLAAVAGLYVCAVMQGPIILAMLVFQGATFALTPYHLGFMAYPLALVAFAWLFKIAAKKRLHFAIVIGHHH